MFSVNCEWAEWKVGECDKTCGGGVRTNTRIKKSEAKYGGKECKGRTNVTQDCNVQNCPGKALLSINFVENLSSTLFEDFEMLLSKNWDIYNI